MASGPIVNGLREEWGDRVTIMQVNIHRQDSRALVNRLAIRFTPTFVLFDGAGREAWRASGVLNADAVREQLRVLG